MIKTSRILMVLVSALFCGNSISSATQSEIFKKLSVSDFRTHIQMIDFEPHEQDKVQEAAELIKKVLVSKKFKAAILGHMFNGRKSFSDNRGLSNAQIYQKIIEGSEKLTPGKDYKMDVTLVAYYEDVITVGYTYPNTHKIWMNRKYFGRQNPPEITTNLIHEWTHKLGFDHDVSPTPERRYSVPYAVGYIVRDLARDLF